MKINIKDLGWAFGSLAITLIIHFYAPQNVIIQSIKVFSFIAFLLNLMEAFNIKFKKKKK